MTNWRDVALAVAAICSSLLLLDALNVIHLG